MDTEKMKGLETQIGARGTAEIHSGKRSALRAWVMAATGRNAASILYIGTAELGAIYNDTTDAKLKALMASPDGLKDKPYPGEGMEVIPGPRLEWKDVKDENPTPKTPEDLKPTPEPKAPKPQPVKPSGNALEDRVREIAREEDAEVSKALGTATAQLLNTLVKDMNPGTDEKKVREIAAEEAAKHRDPERVIVVTPKEGKEDRKDVGVQHRMFPLLLKTVQAGLNPALVGPAGSGKTHAAHAVSVALNRAFELQGSCVTKTDVTGFIDAGGRYQSTPFSRSFSNGGVLLCDEMDGWQANATLALNAALANGHTSLPTGMMPRHSDWVAIIAMNTYGTGASRQYVGRNQMDAATLNRLAFISWDYDEALEGSIIGVKTAGAGPVALEEGGIPTANAWIKRVHAIRKAVDTLKIRHIVSPRATMGGVALFSVGVGQKHAEDMLIWQGMDAEQRARVENQVVGF